MAWEIFDTFGGYFHDLANSLSDIATGFVAVIVAAAVIYITALVWRKYREATNKV